MSLAVAVPFGVASAVVYGASIVVQHRTAQEQADGTGHASAAGLVRLFRHPVFMLAIAGDLFGFVLQIIALSTGPVVVIQPLVVLMLPVSLGVSYLLGGHRPTRGDLLGVMAVILGLGVFLAIVGAPNAGRVPHTRTLGLAVILVVIFAAVLAAVVAGRNRTIRGVAYGAAGGACFGTLAVMVDAASERASQRGLHGLFDSPHGLVPLGCIAVLGTGGMVLTQMSFQVGALGATLPANIAVDPFTGVLLGAILLREHIPHTPIALAAYGLCVIAVVGGAIRLANPADGSIEVSRPAL